MISSTVSKESAPKSLVKLASETTSFSSTPNLKNKTHLNKLYNFRKEINKNIEIHFFNNDYYDKSELVPLLHDAKFI